MIAPGTEALISSTGPFVQEFFAEGDEGRDYFLNSKVLVIGAGGLGCELLKSLALTGFKNIDVIDMDTIDLSNLNRQFLFREGDIGKPKCECAAAFIKKRVPNINITSHFCMIQDKDDEFYKQFNVVIGGLDSVKARNWISANLCRIARETNGEITIPYIDGGTEAWKGHVKVIYPLKTACMHCQSELFPPPVVYQACTVVSNPRQPEHCIVWAKEFQWQKLRPNETIDGDNDEHIKWIMEQAIIHQKEFKVDGEITEKLTKGVVKNIIPAIASTQAVIAAMCATEALKYITATGPTINNNLLFVGDAACGLFGNNFLFEKKEDCDECARRLNKVKYVENELISGLIARIKEEFNYDVSNLRSSEKTIYMPIIAQTKENLNKPVDEFLQDGATFIATAKGSSEPFEFIIEK
ncbi:NEDD8-activating enzyme E1 catalytic subunit [Tritrichomonas foetus]|uniref:NEDD8-activating enzyme E1 catalytic subunit n=1 Tax=Tritrichomonas foetus TaxID=1144522 RepID=A0A1J4KLH0_9EUKA|nr:NEDD8-activating enzyme E1 catalytic subunit [Tritrichomonas foetus]|eukprot:OHT10534.1 NEDD8-activating enzyme E1 catalytic subunit [Tritrichomonas foetus]